MTSAQQLRESRKKSLIECINNGIINKKDIVRKTGINIYVIHNLWIEDDVKKALKGIEKQNNYIDIYENPPNLIKDSFEVKASDYRLDNLA